jgi:hypothetical protein
LVPDADVLVLMFQVTELSPEETESLTGGYGKSIGSVIIGLKTIKGTKQLRLEASIYDALIKEKVSPFNSLFQKFLITYLCTFNLCALELFESWCRNRSHSLFLFYNIKGLVHFDYLFILLGSRLPRFLNSYCL